MSQERSEKIPVWTQGDRLRKARMLTGMTVREFATHIGVSHGTVTSAETDARAVRPITFKAWALATGVPTEWLREGVEPTSPNGPDGGGKQTEQLARLTDQKRSRTRVTDTRRYLAASALAA